MNDFNEYFDTAMKFHGHKCPAMADGPESGPCGNESARRCDEAWGMKFQTCGNPSTTKTPVGYTFSQVNDSNDCDVRIIGMDGT